MKANDTGIWFPFSQNKTAPEPVHIVRGSGALLFDAEGKTYIDAIASWWTNIHGHAHPHIAQKVYDQHCQLEHLIFAGFTHPPAIELASRLLGGHLPAQMRKIFFSDNGSTAVEVGIKMAIQYWQNTGHPKSKILALQHAYHGDTFGSMSVSERGPFTQPFHPFLFDVEFIETPYPGNEEASFAAMRRAVQNRDVAAFIYEPLLQGAGGMRMYAAESLDRLLGIAREHDVLCIADEVMTGFYRTGRMFAGDACTNQPDIQCLSKGLSGGTMALAITACTQNIFEAFYSDDRYKAFYHGHSFTANPLACAAALASLDLLEEKTFPAHIQRIIEKHEAFAKKLAGYDSAEQVRQTGTVVAFDIKTGADTGYFNSIRDRMYAFFLDRGVVLRPLGNTLYIMPPYCTTDAQLETVYDAIFAFLETGL